MTGLTRATGALALLGLCLFLFFWGLGRLPFYTKGEPREGLEVWEEVHNGEWILPMRNGRELPSKPPLFHWLGGVTALARGEVDELSIRFPSALLATITVLLTFWVGAVKWGPPAGLFAGAILATTFEFLRSATHARVDMTLTAFLVAAFFALERLVTAERPERRMMAAFYVSMGLATLGKGPVGILLPGLVGFVYLALRRDLWRILALRPFTGGLVTLAIAGSWYVAAIFAGGEAFVWKQLWVENFGRFFAAGETGAGHVHPWYYMVGAFFTGFAPWSFFVVPLGIYLWHERDHLESRGALFPLVWFASVFAFYAISESKRTVYLLPVYPAVALLLGAWWARLADEGILMPKAVDRLLQGVGVVLGIAILVVFAALFGENAGLAPLSWLEPILHEKDAANLPIVQDLMRRHASTLAVWVAVLVPVLGLFVISVRRGRWGLVLASLVGFMASTVAIVNAIFHPEIAWQRTFKPMMSLVRELVGEEDGLYFHRTFDYGAVFYSQRHIPPLGEALPVATDDGRRTYVLMWESCWDALPDGSLDRFELLHRSNGTGPKGRDRLLLTYVKSPLTAEDLPPTPAGGACLSVDGPDPDPEED